MKYNRCIFFIGLILMACQQPQARKPINKTKKTSQLQTSIQLNKMITAIEESKIKKYIKLDSTLTYTNSPFGFYYAKIKNNNKLKTKPVTGNIVTFTKTVYGLNNKLIYSKAEKTIQIGKSNEIKGIEEGLKLMQEDEEFKFIFSSFVSHGFSGDGYKIGKNTPIVVKVKILKIK